MNNQLYCAGELNVLNCSYRDQEFKATFQFCSVKFCCTDLPPIVFKLCVKTEA